MIFGSLKENTINNYVNVIKMILERWAENPLKKELESLIFGMERIKNPHLGMRVWKEKLYMSNGFTAYRSEPTKNRYKAFIKTEKGESEIDTSADLFNKMLIGEEGEEITKKEYYNFKHHYLR